MKKCFLVAALAMCIGAANAQVTVEGSKFFDNWSLTLKGGGVTPLQNYKMIDNARGLGGIEFESKSLLYLVWL